MPATPSQSPAPMTNRTVEWSIYVTVLTTITFVSLSVTGSTVEISLMMGPVDAIRTHSHLAPFLSTA